MAHVPFLFIITTFPYSGIGFLFRKTAPFYLFLLYIYTFFNIIPLFHLVLPSECQLLDFYFNKPGFGVGAFCFRKA